MDTIVVDGFKNEQGKVKRLVFRGEKQQKEVKPETVAAVSETTEAKPGDESSKE